MKIIGINGSPRREGNTSILLEEALRGARENGAVTRRIELGELDIAPCVEAEYDHMGKDGHSLIDDDMKIVYDGINDSDALIVASPVFFGSLSAQTKIMVDRFQCVWLARNKYRMDVFNSRKQGIFLCVSASDRTDFFENSRAIIKHFFSTIGTRYIGDIHCTGVENKGDIRALGDLLKKAYDLGKTLSSGPLNEK